MKRLFCLVICLVVLIPGSQVSAKNRSVNDMLEKEMLETTSKEELLEIMTQEGISDSLKKEAEEQYIQVAEEELEAECRANSARVGYQIKNYKSTVVDSFKDRRGKYKTMITAGTEVSKTYDISFKIAAGGILDGYTLEAGLNCSGSTTIKGPDFNTKLPGSTRNATHSMVIGVLRSAITHVTYDEYDASTGNFVAHVDRYVATGQTVVMYNLLVSDSGSSFFVGHCTLDKSKNFGSLSAYRNILESSDVKQAYSW